MTEITIPYIHPILDQTQKTKIFRKNRETVLSELRLSGIPEIASTLNQDTVYKMSALQKGNSTIP